MTSPNTSRTALVTGSTSGIGAAIARALANRGWNVVVTGRDRVRGQAVCDDIRSSGSSAHFVPADLTASPDELRAFCAAALDAADGQIDALVHNAAVCHAVDTVSLQDNELDAALAINIRAPHVLTAALAPSMVERGDGSIVVIGSWMAHIGHAIVGLYSATKAAEIQLARSWSAEFGQHGVRVNTVSPGAIRTAINAADDDTIRAITNNTPAGRPGTADEIAATVAWLLSDDARYIHAAELAVDGGITATG